MSAKIPATIDEMQTALLGAGYVADRALATVVTLALKMGRPLLLEGEAGVGKTEIAKTLAAMLGRKLIRLQCYEGLDVASAVYEWNYAGQMMAIRLAEAEGQTDRSRLENDLFSERYLIKRPLLQALEGDVGGAPVLLIDELGYLNIKPEQANIFFKMMEQRYQRKATIITTQLPVDHWHSWIGDASIADAILDRVMQRVQKLNLTGESMRRPSAKKSKKPGS